MKKSNWFEEVEHNAFLFCNLSLGIVDLRRKNSDRLVACFRNIITELCDLVFLAKLHQLLNVPNKVGLVLGIRKHVVRIRNCQQQETRFSRHQRSRGLYTRPDRLTV